MRKGLSLSWVRNGLIRLALTLRILPSLSLSLTVIVDKSKSNPLRSRTAIREVVLPEGYFKTKLPA